MPKLTGDERHIITGAGNWLLRPWYWLPQLTPPPTDLQWVNQQSAVSDRDAGGALWMYTPPSGNAWRLQVSQLNNQEFKFSVGFLPLVPDYGWIKVGLSLYHQQSGKIVTFNLKSDTYGFTLWYGRYNSPTSLYNEPNWWHHRLLWSGGIVWLQIQQIDNVRYVRWSVDGIHWYTLTSYAIDDWITPTHIGVGVNANNVTWGCGALFVHWGLIY